MKYGPLGRTGLMVSGLSLGTVSLGIEYGIEAPGDHGRPSEADALSLLRNAAEEGINFFDTAPGYGDSERLLGIFLRSNPGCLVATKVPVFKDAGGDQLRGAALRRAVLTSLEGSLTALRREALDVVQIHNATVDVVRRGELPDALLDAKRQGKVRFLGASVYTEAEAQAVVGAGCFDVLQIAYNLLDQRMAGKVFPAAERSGVGIVARSAFLKGALSAKAEWLPPGLAGLRAAAERARDAMAGSWEALESVALRFCLSAAPVSTVLVGPRTPEELGRSLAATAAGPLPEELLVRAAGLAMDDERLLNPSLWP